MIGQAPTWKETVLIPRARGLVSSLFIGFADGLRWSIAVLVVVWIAAPRAEDVGKWAARAAVSYRNEAIRLQGYDQFTALPWSTQKTDRK